MAPAPHSMGQGASLPVRIERPRGLTGTTSGLAAYLWRRNKGSEFVVAGEGRQPQAIPRKTPTAVVAWCGLDLLLPNITVPFVGWPRTCAGRGRYNVLAFGHDVNGVDLEGQVPSQAVANCWAANGIQFVARYLPVAGSGGDLNTTEIGYIHTAGMLVVAICSTTNSNGGSTCDDTYWTRSNGYTDGVNSANAMITLGLTGSGAGVYIDLAESTTTYCTYMADYVEGFVNGVNATPPPGAQTVLVGVYANDAILTGLGEVDNLKSLMYWDIDVSSNQYGVALMQYTPYQQTLQGVTVDFDNIINTPWGGS